MTTMRLMPSGPPGRASRKALAFHGEIVRLRACGYTLEAIRLALADAGIQVSIATVSREVRHASAHGVADASQCPGSATGAAETPPPWRASASIPPVRPDLTAQPPQSAGKALAEAFIRTVVTNPLHRSRSEP